jgi:hypothetical protein
MTSIWDARRNEEREREENLKLLAGQRSVHSEGRATVASTTRKEEMQQHSLKTSAD